MVEAPEADSGLEELLDRLLGSGGPSAARVRAAGERQAVPLSVGQRQVLLQAASISEAGLWNESVCVSWSGSLNAAALERSLNEVCRRHDVLRTTFCIVDGETYQVVNPPEWRELPTIDLRHLPRQTADDHARSFANAQVQRPFNHAIEAPWRATLVTIADDDHRLYMVVHRVLMDAESVVLLVDELRSMYAEFAEGAIETSLPPPTLQFTDYVLWTGTAATDRDDSDSDAYWQELLSEPLPVVQLRVDRPPSVPTFDGRAYSFDLPFDSIGRLQDLCADEGTTMYAGALAAFVGVLYRWTARTDIIVGTQSSARDRGGLSDVLGNFLTTTLVRIRFHEQVSFRQLLRIVQQNTCDGRVHLELPHQEFARAFLPQDNAEDDAPVRVMFSMQADRRSRELDSDHTRWDLHLEFAGCAEPPQARLVYRSELFDSVTVARFAAELCGFLEASTLDADERISDLSLVWADTRISGESVPELVARVAEQTPQAPAVIFRDEVLTFAELNVRANQLARHLQGRGVGPDQLVGLCLTRSIELVVGVVGILKAGGAYVPLDPSYPAARLGVILSDSKPRVVLTQAELLKQLPGFARDIALCLDSDWPSVATHSPAPSETTPSPQNLAYVLYTSGVHWHTQRRDDRARGLDQLSRVGGGGLRRWRWYRFRSPIVNRLRSDGHQLACAAGCRTAGAADSGRPRPRRIGRGAA